VPPLVLAVAARALLDECARRGVSVDALLETVGVERSQVYNPEARLPADQSVALWGAALSRTGPHLALHAAEGLPFGAYKVIDYLAAHSPTVGEGLRRIATYFSLVDPRARLEVVEGEPMAVRLSVEGGVAPPLPAQEFTFVALVCRSRACSGVCWPLTSAEFAAPAPEEDAEHRRIFGGPVVWGAREARLVIAREAWDTPVRQADPTLLSLVEDLARRLEAELPRGEPDFLARVRAGIAEELKNREASVEGVARRLAMSTRTLQRRLESEGRTFAEVLDEVRAALARAHLRDPQLPLAEVSWLLGFSEQSAFTRAFKRWTGVTPGQWRAAHAEPLASRVEPRPRHPFRPRCAD